VIVVVSRVVTAVVTVTSAGVTVVVVRGVVAAGGVVVVVPGTDGGWAKTLTLLLSLTSIKNRRSPFQFELLMKGPISARLTLSDLAKPGRHRGIVAASLRIFSPNPLTNGFQVRSLLLMDSMSLGRVGCLKIYSMNLNGGTFSSSTPIRCISLVLLNKLNQLPAMAHINVKIFCFSISVIGRAVKGSCAVWELGMGG